LQNNRTTETQSQTYKIAQQSNTNKNNQPQSNTNNNKTSKQITTKNKPQHNKHDQTQTQWKANQQN